MSDTTLATKQAVTVFPILPLLMRRPQLFQGLLVLACVLPWALELVLQQANAQSACCVTDTAPVSIQAKAWPWLDYPAWSYSTVDGLWFVPAPAPTASAASNDEPQTAAAPEPQTIAPAPIKRWQLEVTPATLVTEQQRQLLQMAWAHEQAQAWLLAQHTYQKVLQMDADNWQAWQGLLRVADKLQAPALLVYCQQQIDLRWPEQESSQQETFTW